MNRRTFGKPKAVSTPVKLFPIDRAKASPYVDEEEYYVRFFEMLADIEPKIT